MRINNFILIPLLILSTATPLLAHEEVLSDWPTSDNQLVFTEDVELSSSCIDTIHSVLDEVGYSGTVNSSGITLWMTLFEQRAEDIYNSVVLQYRWANQIKDSCNSIKQIMFALGDPAFVLHELSPKGYITSYKHEGMGGYSFITPGATNNNNQCINTLNTVIKDIESKKVDVTLSNYSIYNNGYSLEPWELPLDKHIVSIYIEGNGVANIANSPSLQKHWATQLFNNCDEELSLVAINSLEDSNNNRTIIKTEEGVINYQGLDNKEAVEGYITYSIYRYAITFNWPIDLQDTLENKLLYFQQLYNLPVTGIIDLATFNKFVELENENLETLYNCACSACCKNLDN